MKFSVLTLFPELFETVMGASITGRAAKQGLLSFSFVNIRDFSSDRHKRVDDYPYGAGGGMLMQAQPIFDAYRAICGEEKPHLIFLSPQGKRFTQTDAVRLSGYPHVAFLCGHYEGVDERVLEKIVDEELSLGDFVLTGGELPAMVMMDAISRCVPHVLDSEATFETESVQSGFMEYPQYTRPPEWEGARVPENLLSGSHAAVEAWRREQMIRQTFKKRPSMLEDNKTRGKLTEQDILLIKMLLAQTRKKD